MKIVGVKFNNRGKVYYFNSNNISLELGDNVVVETEKGLQYGKTVLFVDDKNINNKIIYKNILRVASALDNKQYTNNLNDALYAKKKCISTIKKNKLDMKIIDANYNFDRSQLVFRFLADERVDFRQLAKELGSIFKTRIELRQVGIRDKAKEIGGVGPCGRLLCCNSFLTEFEPVTISMAKNQLLALNPSKINGVCGRLLCCLNYENSNYDKYRKNLPSVGQTVITTNGKGKVISIDIFNGKYKILTDNNEVIGMDVHDGSEK